MKAEEAIAHTVELLIEQMDGGIGHWHMPWNALAVMPRNGITGANYRGSNIMSLLASQLSHDFTSVDWATYKQWAEHGGQVKKGSRATWGIFWKRLEPRNDTERERMMASSFALFNRDQVDIDHEPPPPAPRTPVQDFFRAVPSKTREGMPSYSPTHDLIWMPDLEDFHPVETYWSTCAHEHIHWTGHKSRLDRDQTGRFGTKEYAVEELIAELGAAFTMGTLSDPLEQGMIPAPRLDHAQYLQHWIDVLREKPSILWTVAARAQAATDNLTSYSTKESACAST